MHFLSQGGRLVWYLLHCGGATRSLQLLYALVADLFRLDLLKLCPDRFWDWVPEAEQPELEANPCHMTIPNLGSDCSFKWKKAQCAVCFIPRFTNHRYKEPCKFIPIFQFTNIICTTALLTLPKLFTLRRRTDLRQGAECPVGCNERGEIQRYAVLWTALTFLIKTLLLINVKSALTSCNSLRLLFVL
jgi:hypothetical protein